MTVNGYNPRLNSNSNNAPAIEQLRNYRDNGNYGAKTEIVENVLFSEGGADGVHSGQNQYPPGLSLWG